MTGSLPMDATRAGGSRICGCLDFLSSENVGSHAKENRAGDAATRRAQVELPFFFLPAGNQLGKGSAFSCRRRDIRRAQLCSTSCRQEIGWRNLTFLPAGRNLDKILLDIIPVIIIRC
jgi:hypothetical protein